MATFRTEKSSIRIGCPTFLTLIHTQHTTLNKRGREEMKLAKSILKCQPFAT